MILFVYTDLFPYPRFLLPNGKMEIFTLRTPEMQLLEVVDHVLGNYGLSSHDAGMKDKVW